MDDPGEGNGGAGARAILNGDLSRSVAVGSDGRFRFTEVVPPYDLTVIAPDNFYANLVEFRGLTRPDPLISMYGAADEHPRRAEVTGTIGGVDVPLPEGAQVLLALVDAASRISHMTRGGADTGEMTFSDFEWLGPRSYSGSLVGVLVQTRPDGGLDFLRAGAITPFEIEDGGEVSVDLVLDQPIETKVASLSVETGAYSFEAGTGFATFSVLGANFSWSGLGISLPQLVSFPAEGARIQLSGMLPGAAVVAITSGEATADEEHSLSLPSSVAFDIVSPAPGEEVETRTPRIEWLPLRGATGYRLELEGGGGRTWILPPTATSIEIPDYGEELFQLSEGENYHWRLVALTAPGFSPDEQADPSTGGRMLFQGEVSGFTALGEFSIAP